jgi:hypothetical protein
MSSEKITISITGPNTSSATGPLTVADTGYTSQNVSASITPSTPLVVTLEQALPQYYDPRAKALCDNLMKYGWDPEVQLIHGLLQTSPDYVGGLPISPSTYWGSSDNYPTLLALYDYGYPTEANAILAKVTALGCLDPKNVNCGQRYEAYMKVLIVKGNPGDQHFVLLPPNGTQHTVVVPPPHQDPNVDQFGKTSKGVPYKIQQDAWNLHGAGIPNINSLSVDVLGPQCMRYWLVGDLANAQLIANALIHAYVSSGYQHNQVTWQLGQVMFLMRVLGYDTNTAVVSGTTTYAQAFTAMENTLWSLLGLYHDGLLPNQYSGGGHDPESQDAGLLPYSATAINGMKAAFGMYKGQ